MSNNTEALKERGMIFNGEMVRAILDGRKTQTRRVMAVQPEQENLGLRRIIESKNGKDIGKCFWSQSDATGLKARSKPFKCPFGKVGDRIWVREAWADAGASAPNLTLYRANYPDHVPSHFENVPPPDEIRWTPSIHMPRWASRITLEITGVRVEQLQDVSEQGAISEGIDTERLAESQDNYDCIADHNMTGRPTAKGHFADLWQSIYGTESWEANPWVWVIEFKRVEASND